MNICNVYSTVLQYAVNYMYNEDCMQYINTDRNCSLLAIWEHSSDMYICEINNYHLDTVQNKQMVGAILVISANWQSY